LTIQPKLSLKKIITCNKFLALIDHYDQAEIKVSIFLYLLLITGRRSIDILRLDFENMRKIDEDKYLVQLNFDKTSKKKQIILIDWNAIPLMACKIRFINVVNFIFF